MLKFNADRAKIRHQVYWSKVIEVELIPQLVQKKKKNTEKPPQSFGALIWDISEKGVGIWTEQKIDSGSVFKMVVLTGFHQPRGAKPIPRELTVQCCWTRTCEDVAGYRSGFQIVGEDTPPLLLAMIQDLLA